MDNREEQLRQRAYDIWQSEGEPHGRDRDHWEQAERDFAPATSEGAEPKPAAGPKAGGTRRKKAEPSDASAAQTDAGAPEQTAKPKARKPRATKAD